LCPYRNIISALESERRSSGIPEYRPMSATECSSHYMKVINSQGESSFRPSCRERQCEVAASFLMGPKGHIDEALVLSLWNHIH
jgi:hypothetical protein